MIQSGNPSSYGQFSSAVAEEKRKLATIKKQAAKEIRLAKKTNNVVEIKNVEQYWNNRIADQTAYIDSLEKLNGMVQSENPSYNSNFTKIVNVGGKRFEISASYYPSRKRYSAVVHQLPEYKYLGMADSTEEANRMIALEMGIKQLNGRLKDLSESKKNLANGFSTPNNKIIRFDYSDWLDAGTAVYYDKRTDKDIKFDFILNKGELQTTANIPKVIETKVLAMIDKQSLKNKKKSDKQTRRFCGFIRR